MRAPAVEPRKKFLKLLALVARNVVQLEQLANLGELETQALAAQRELQPHSIAVAEDPAGSLARGSEQALVLVEPDGARSDVELSGELGNRIRVAHCASQQMPVLFVKSAYYTFT